MKHKLEIEFDPDVHPARVKIFLDGLDISAAVHTVELVASVDGTFSFTAGSHLVGKEGGRTVLANEVGCLYCDEAIHHECPDLRRALADVAARKRRDEVTA